MGVNTGNMYRKTGLRNGGRKAGIGISSDNYGDESGRPNYEPWPERVRFPNDGVKPEELNGECIVIRRGKVDE